MIQGFHLARDGKTPERLADVPTIIERFQQRQGLLWVDIEAPTPEETNLLAEAFAFHPVAVQACREVNSQPLVHTYDGYLFMVIHAVGIQTRGDLATTSEVDIFWGRSFVLTYHLVPVRSITEMRDLCAADGAAVMSHGADFLLHAIVDKIIDNFAPALERI